MRFFNWDRDPAVLLDSGVTLVVDPFSLKVSEGDTAALLRDEAAPELSRDEFMAKFGSDWPFLEEAIRSRQSGDAKSSATP